MIDKNNTLITVSCILFVLSPVMSNYIFIGPISVGDLSIFLAILTALKYIKFNVSFILVFFVTLLILLINLLLFSLVDIYPRSLPRASFYLIIVPIFLSLKPFYYVNMLKIYSNFSLLFSTLLLLQIFFYYILNVSLIMQLPLPVYEVDALEIIDISSSGFRGAGLFREPSYFAIFTLPALFLYILRKEYQKYSLVFIAMIASTSSLGIMVALISLVSLVTKIQKRRKMFLNFMLIVPIVLTLVVYFLITSNNLGVLRFYEVFSGGGSLKIRLYSIFDLYNAFTIFVDPSFSNYVFGTADLWYNSFIYLVANFGLIFLLPFIEIFRKIGVKGSLATFLLILFTHAFSTSFFTLFVTLFYSFYKLYDVIRDDKNI